MHITELLGCSAAASLTSLDISGLLEMQEGEPAASSEGYAALHKLWRAASEHPALVELHCRLPMATKAEAGIAMLQMPMVECVMAGAPHPFLT